MIQKVNRLSINYAMTKRQIFMKLFESVMAENAGNSAETIHPQVQKSENISRSMRAGAVAQGVEYLPSNQR
jgi:hypothetical protein